MKQPSNPSSKDAPDGARRSVHKQASKNYFHLESDMKRQSMMDADNRFSQRLSMMNVMPAKQAEFLDEPSIDYCCDVLQAKFGFQQGSVDNQREHALLLLANCAARANSGSDDANHHVRLLHDKLFSNYKEWCAFLGIKPLKYQQVPANTPLTSVLHMELMLYLLIWGESANLRHMPECLCYVYHQLLANMIADPHHGDTRPANWFLNAVLRPVWKEASVMQKKNAMGKHLEHTKVRNYDDLNEFFWRSGCLKIPVDQIGAALHSTAGKTFYEHRSIFSLVLNYYRIFHFNFMFLIGIAILNFAVRISPNGGKSGFDQFSKIGTVVEPYHMRDLNKACAVLIGSHAFLNFFKCVLEVGHGFQLLTDSKTNSATSSRSMTYGLALTMRLVWSLLFTAAFALMFTSAPPKTGGTDIINYLATGTAVYIVPGLIILALQTFFPGTGRSWFSKFIREGDSCYTGRNMAPPFSFQIQYYLFWFVLLVSKFFVSYWVLVGPLVLPSLAIWEMKLTYGEGSIGSYHNLGIIVSLWAPVVFISNYDTQIYFTIFQAIVGAVMGWMMKVGEVRGVEALSKAFRVAPQLFDTKVVTELARLADAQEVEEGRGSQSAVYQSQMMLRFVVVWNEIVNSFREGDLVDDKEAAILQYDIQNTGEVFEPVFLSAGKLNEAMAYAVKLGKSGRGDSELRIQLVQNDCLGAVKSFFNASMYVLEALLAPDDTETLDGFRLMEQAALDGQFLQLFDASALLQVRTMAIEFLEAVLDLPDPDSVSPVLPKTMVHPMGIIRNFVSKMDNLLNALRLFCRQPAMAAKFQNVNFVSNANSYAYAAKGLVNLFHSDTAMGAATRAYLLMSLDRQDAMPKCGEAQRRLGFFMQSLLMEIPQLNAIRSMRSFSVVTPFYSEGVIFSLDELNNPLENHPIFNKASELDKKITILKYLITIHPEEWENFLERIDVSSVDAAVNEYPMELRLWASYRGQTLARTVQGMMLYEDAIKILHWLEIGSSPNRTPEQKQQQLEDMIRLKFSYVCACQVYGKHRAENKQQANDIDFLLQTYPNLRVAYVDTIPGGNNGANRYDTVLIKAEGDEIAEVYRWELPGDPVLGEGKPENQNNALPFTRGEYIQTIDMNQQHYFEECLKMPQLLVTADLHPSKQPVTIIGMREHIFTGNASSLAKFKTWQELVFVTLSQRVLANPLYVRMHYGHPDIFDKVMVLTRGGVSKASKGINLSEDVFAGFNTTLRGGVVTHVEFMQCGKGRDVAMSQISMFEGKLANGAGETCLAREAYRMGAFMDFFRLNSMYYSHTGFYFATWLTIVTTYVYIYSKVYLALSGVQEQVIEQMNSTQIISLNAAQRGDFDTRVYHDLVSIVNTQYIIQAGMFLTLPLIVVYFAELGLFGGLLKFLNMILTAGPAFFVFQVGTTMHYFDHNIMHGNAKYQATGRGFKITRESFVLLYKAYSASHYRKAWELVGLSLLYLAYGNFALGNYDLATPDNMFASNYKGTSQGFGIQTFALWVVSSMWLLSPFIFNADGLDYEKTKSDIAAWCKWMFMEANETDPDKVHTGGWISWWKGDQEEYYATNGIARFTVILRESRHFFIVWYVVTLKLEAKYVLFVLAAAGATLVLFYVFHLIGLGMKKANYIGRAALYFFLVICFVVGGFVAMNFVLFKKDDSNVAWNKSLCLFFGYFAVVYGINEMLRVANFKGLAVHNLAVVTQLAFFFDFMFSALLLIPLLILSCIPFMNAIQTRMMFNEGFSKAVSASSQHAFSLAAAMGVLVGLAAGWQYYMLLSIDVSSAYSTYLQMYKLGSFIKPGNGLTTYITLGGSVAGSIATSFLGYTLGHRMTVLISGMMSVLGCLVLSLIPTLAKSGSASSAPFMVGILLLSAALGMMLPAVACYIYEISTYDMRSKTMLPFAFAFVVGTAISSYQSGGAVGWVWQSFWCALLMALVTPLMNMFPDSPQWVLERKGYEECETALSILRQRPDNAAELRELREDQAHAKKDQDGGSSMYKFGLAVICMIISSLSVASLNIFVANTFKSFADDNLVFLNSLTIEAAGVLVSFFVMDKWPHRNLLAFTLLGVGLCAGALGANDCFTLLKQDYSQRKLILTLFMYVMFFIKGLGLTSTIWVNVTGLFAAKSRYVAIPLLFALWFAVPAASVALRVSSYTKNAYPWLFALAGLCLIALFMIVMASNRVNGLICTRADMKKDKARRDRLRGSRHSRTPGSFSRQRRQSRSGRQSRSNSMAKSFQGSYHLVASPSANQHVV
ncbi:unnamed protein product [Aphanomyces euteiches]|uniref:1,3-beta-glucan synthase n=1 Tax=Aphanomyces euteiches TaxID=100861 RepID=A0A6G0WN64_9STRA|nr:hypothetical protein Ae201684_013378 [Aphanomyces euteiches]KAH9063140.1 hypothetical protein Ae201684P_009403 [Aphanomyces euteiches]